MSGIYLNMNAWQEIQARVFEGFTVQSNVSPNWLINPATRRKLKLDQYYPEAAIALRNVGLTAKGRGADALAEGTVYRDGALPINLSGGLKAKGHPVGATGVSMHAISYRQLTNRAGEMQKPGANLGLVFNMGGSGVANYASVLEAGTA